MPDGKRFPNRQWALHYVSLDGPVLSMWKVPDTDHDDYDEGDVNGFQQREIMANLKLDARKLKSTVHPSFINITDANVAWTGVFEKSTLKVERKILN